MALNCVWMVVFDREIMEAALAVLFSMCVTLYICMFISYRKLDQSVQVLEKQSRFSDVWLTRMLVQNGLGIYATWCTVATHLNLAFVLVYRSAHDISNQDACTIALGILSAIIVLFIVTDWFFLDRFSRYTFTPYLVLVVAFAGSLSKNYEEGARNTTFTIVLLAVSGFATVVKFILLDYRHCRRTEGGVRISDESIVKV
ncbi:hypothetical protein DPMN_127982 [Dreissena polymorpha]|uniref:Uncharacterized protein n=1 Tax=Dreissena polymorpha TaxID=45954 RepID=A0A9D4GZX8_DREPO|nr:hypothetical protein DPMN_127982 [Dreissena polymorpha]